MEEAGATPQAVENPDDLLLEKPDIDTSNLVNKGIG